MNKWQSSRALKRVIFEIKTLSEVLSLALENVISTPADEDKPLQDLRAPVSGFSSTPGMLQLLELPNLALLANEICVSINELLAEKKQLPVWSHNPRLEAAYVGLGNITSMLEAGLEYQSDNFEQVAVLLNRIRDSRNVAQVFSSAILLEKQEINYRKVFEEKPQLLQELMEKQLMFYNKACKILLKNPADKKALEVVIKVINNLSLLLRDYRAGTRWGLSSALMTALPQENLNQALFRILAGFSWSLHFSTKESIVLQHEEMSGVLDKDLENSVFDEIAKLIDINTGSEPEISFIRQWLSQRSSKGSRLDSSGILNNADSNDEASRIRYYAQDARNKTIDILGEQITALLDSISEIADEMDDSSVPAEEMKGEIERLGELLRFIGLTTLASNIEDDLAAASGQQAQDLLFSIARILVISSNELAAYQDNHELKLFTEVKGSPGIPVINSARLHALQAVIACIKTVISNLDLIAENNTHVLQETCSTLGQLSRVFQLINQPEQSKQFQIAENYIADMIEHTTLETKSIGFQRLCQLMINSLWYFEQLILGREDDSAVFLEKSAGFAKELLADISLRKAQPGNMPDHDKAASDDNDESDEKGDIKLAPASPPENVQPQKSWSASKAISDSNEIDEEHKQRMVFSNEFDEILLSLREELSDLQSVGQQTGRVRNCSRLFHTLGGSGRSVAHDIAAVSVAMEKLFDSLSAKPLGITDEIMGFTEEVLDVLALLRDGILDPENDNVFKAGSFKASINNICIQAIAYEKALNGNNPPLEIKAAYPGITQTKTALHKYIQAEDPLLTGFLQEARELHARIHEGCLAQQKNPENSKALAQISSALSLLQGAAEMADCESIASVVCALLAAIEKIMPEKVTKHGVDQAFIKIMTDSVDWLGDTMSRLETNQSINSSEPLLKAIEEYVPETILAPENEQTETPVVDFDSKSTEQQLFLPAPESEPEPAIAQASDDSGQSEALTTQQLPSESRNNTVDQELLAVFLDEMTELLQDLDDLYLHWQQEPHDKTILENYLRILHTLKGSSALAQDNALSNAAHEYESFVISAGKSSGFDNEFFTGCDIHLHGLHKICALYSKDDHGFITRTPEAAELEAELPGKPEALTGKDEIKDKLEPEKKSITTGNKHKNQLLELTKDSQKIPGAGKETELPGSAASFKSQSETVNPLSAAEEQVRVSSQLLNYLLNDADEINFSRNRLEKSFHDVGNLLIEMDETLIRLNSFVKRVDENASHSPGSRQQGTAHIKTESDVNEFDELEMDRYTELQELSLSLTEDYEDLQDIRRNLSSRLKEIDQALMGQQRLTNSLQDGLISSQMLPFSSIVPRLRRLVRQTARELNKDIQIEVQNQQGNLDKNILQAVITPFEHILRNAIDHGIEPAHERVKAGKPVQATISLMVARQGATISVVIQDDGQGIDVEKVKKRAVESGLLEEAAIISDEEAMQLIFQPGFSTADQLSTISGRGVGLDVVKNQINQVGGSVEVVSEPGKGTAFTMTLPLTSSLNRALLFKIQETPYVVLMDTLDGVLVEKLARIYQSEGNTAPPVFEYGAEKYEYLYLGKLIDAGLDPRPESVDAAITLLLVKGKQKNQALHIDSIIESRDLVVKSFGKQFTSMAGISGGVIMPDGNVAIVLDLASLVNLHHENKKPSSASVFLQSGTRDSCTQNKKIMVVDDSITVRKVTTGILERNSMEVVTAKNGLEAVELLETYLPDVILLDIEMPKMDGFEVATYIRTQESPLKDIPIIMITSRIGEKHRNRAGKIGVNEYLCKPFQEESLIKTIQSF